jgi:formylglycine-generating enzyme required for sulfatase activity
MIAMTITASLMMAASAYAGWPGDRSVKCKPDAVKVGSTCMDKYEASVWFIPSTNPSGKSNARLVKKVQGGTATLANLQAGGAVQRGVTGDDYGACLDDGVNCNADQIYAVSTGVVTPASYVTWFQANVLCSNSNKRLPTNAEWQAAATMSSSAADAFCNIFSGAKSLTGDYGGCFSAFGAYDMTGNVAEWVADWVPRSTTSGTWSGSGDYQSLAGAATTGEPGALLRGGFFNNGANAGPLTVSGLDSPSSPGNAFGFRCAR